MTATSTKQCAGPCGQCKPLAAFRQLPRRNGRRQGICRACERLANKVRRARRRVAESA